MHGFQGSVEFLRAIFHDERGEWDPSGVQGLAALAGCLYVAGCFMYVSQKDKRF
eukprot:CAMPEP_0184296532 /NCGR_PEP_ID=MMETSP1049-20130417/7504_1 /TAXON_ID=77928 /ORGANISM="Proteomonas sulcata, Strain CCMP704" /LENGTH=53 /DNA_ID=CAMNT_0026605817 /DNA_START=115 /DNA_END=276 /DNA_ORIENTATION=+